MAKDPKTEEQKAAQKKKRKKIAATVLAPVPVGAAKAGSRIASRIKARRQAKAVKAFDELSFGQAFKQKRKELGKDSTFTWRGKKYTTVTKDDLKKTVAKKVKKPVRKRRVARLKKRQARATTKGRTQRASNLQKRISRLEKSMKFDPLKKGLLPKSFYKDNPELLKKSKIGYGASGGLATNDLEKIKKDLQLGLRNRPEKKAVRAMKPGSGKSVAAKVKRTSVPKNKKNMDLAPKRRKGASIKGYKRGDFVQGYDDKLDESLGVRHPSKKTQSLKSRRAESKGAEKAAGKRAYAAVKTMDKGTRKAKPRGVGVAKRGYGKALS